MSNIYLFKIQIQTLQIYILKTFAIRRISNKVGSCIICYIFHLRLTELYSIQYTCSRSILTGYADHTIIVITSIECIRFFIYFCTRFFYRDFMIRKIIPREIEVIKFSHESRSYISRYHGCLYQYSPAPAHRIIKRCPEFPSTEEYKCCCERLFKRCFSCFMSITTLMKRIS